MKEKKLDTAELNRLEKLIKLFGQMETMRMLDYVSVAPIYSWRKSKKIPHWAKLKINKLYKERLNENN